MAWPKPMPVVSVEWVDSHGESRWQDCEAWKVEECVLMCRSVGWLWHEDETRVVLAQSFSEGGLMDNLMHIPRCAVRKLTVLRKA